MMALLTVALLAFQPAIDNQAAENFSLEAGGLRHQSGFLCPMTLPDANLVGSRKGSPVDPSALGAFCEYQEQGQPVAYLAFSPREDTTLTNSWCRALPAALHLQMGPRLPGVAKYEDVHSWPDNAPTPTIQGEPVAPVTCLLARPPFTPAIIVYSVAAFDHDGWTVKAVGTPIPPPCCAGYRGARLIAKDMLALILVLETTEKFRSPGV